MVGTIGAGMAIGGGLMDIFGGGSQQPTPPPNPVPAQPGVSALTGGGPQGIGSLSQYNLGGQYMPAYQQAISQYLANPYGPQAIQAANMFGPAAQGIAGQGMGNAAAIGGTVNPLLQQAFDPQQALYQRTAGQVSDQEQAMLANAGLGQTPWGAGAYGQTMGDFNLNWQNQQLQRMLSGVQGAGSAAGSALNLGGQGLGLGMAGGAAPFQTYGQVAQYPLGAYGQASQYGQQASQVPQTGISDWLNYINQSSGAQNAMTNLYSQQLGAQRQQFGENLIGGAAIGSGLGALGGSPMGTGIGNWFRGLTGTTPYGDPSAGA